MKQKRILWGIFLLMSLVGFVSCGKKEAEEASAEATPLFTLPIDLSQATASSTPTPAPTPEVKAEAQVTQTVAYFLPSVEGFPMLYVAFEVENIGTSSIVVKDATVEFNTGKNKVGGTFSITQYKDDVIRPGQKVAFPIWYPYDKETSLTADSPITADVTITTEVADVSRTPRSITASNARLIQNYPNFPTLSYSLENPSTQHDYSLVLIYISMYDKDEKLIGTWSFIQDSSLQAETKRSFVEQMRTLAIPGAVENTETLVERAIGME